MTAEPLTVAAMKKRLSLEEQKKLDRSLAARLGVALFKDPSTGTQHLISHGRGGDIGTTYPPSSVGSAVLVAYVSPEPVPPTMRSPLLDWEQPRQIQRPNTSPPTTVWPDVRGR
jgi:hypothetical protein